ncbi:MAG TPA: DUF86 domain-containing protein [Methanocorpusculum sp.]|nr:DUF86 domain-containing protein [Methanocorpusculum sp.]
MSKAGGGRPWQEFSPERDRVLLAAIAERCRRIGEITSHVSRAEFLAGFLYQDAVIQALEVIGEACGKLSPGLRERHEDIAFRQMKELRNVLIHQFDSVDLERVWVIARRSVPEFCAKVRRL